MAMPQSSLSAEEIQSLQNELNYFREEKEKVRAIIGQIGGVQQERREKVVTITFIAIMALLFLLEILHYLAGVAIPFPPLFSLSAGVLLVSLKIIWMMHKQTQVEHFQFWILNSIEFRLTDLSKKFQDLEKNLKKESIAPQPAESAKG